MTITNGQVISPADFVGPGATYPTIETTTGTTHSLTTTANQRVIVWAKGDATNVAAGANVNLKYNAVLKDTAYVREVGNNSSSIAFSLMYTQTPGAATQNITVDGGGTLANVVIMVMKF